MIPTKWKVVDAHLNVESVIYVEEGSYIFYNNNIKVKYKFNNIKSNIKMKINRTC